MTEPAPPDHPGPGAGLRAAGRAVQAAQGAQGAEPASSRRLTWDDLQAWPAWALPGRVEGIDADTLVWRLAALWHADALRRCIDGPSLQTAARLLGPAVLQALLEAPPVAAGAAALPAAAELEAAWRHVGRSLALASIERPELRRAVAQYLRRSRGWADADPAAWEQQPCAALRDAALALPAADGTEGGA